jgi:hypothetical protein
LMAMVISPKKAGSIWSAYLVLPIPRPGGNPHALEGSPSLGKSSRYVVSVNIATDVGRNFKLALVASPSSQCSA